MSDTNDDTAKKSQGEPILPAPIGEDGIVQPERGEGGGEAAGGRPKPGSGEPGEDAHDLAHGNDLKTP